MMDCRSGLGCALGGLLLPLALVAIGIIGFLAMAAGIFGVLIGLVWWLVSWLLGPLVFLALLVYFLGRRRE